MPTVSPITRWANSFYSGSVRQCGWCGAQLLRDNSLAIWVGCVRCLECSGENLFQEPKP